MCVWGPTSRPTWVQPAYWARREAGPRGSSPLQARPPTSSLLCQAANFRQDKISLLKAEGKSLELKFESLSFTSLCHVNNLHLCTFKTNLRLFQI